MTKTATVRMLALQPFSGLEGNVKKGDELNVVELRARQLEESGVAKRLPPEDVAEPEAKAEPARMGKQRAKH